MCSLIITAIQRKPKLISPSTNNIPHYNPAFLKECLKDQRNNNLLEWMQSTSEFDPDIFSIAIKLFRWFDIETKFLFLEFYRQLIEEGTNDHNIEDFNTFKEKKFLNFLNIFHNGKQEVYLINLITASLQVSNLQTPTQTQQIRNFAERIITSTIKCYFNTSL
jgi:hypothetical protein